MTKRSLIIIPTYNEMGNIDKILKKIKSLPMPCDVLVVDDNSPDGTGSHIKKLKQNDTTLQLIERPSKLGLGTAYIAGFNYAIKEKYDYVFEMDADLSHNPDEIPNFLNALETHDLVIGSRYITGVNVVNWPLRRLLLSYGANIYTRLILGMKVRDLTAGYKAFRREVLESIPLENIKSNGYSFQIEMTYKAYCKNFKIKEIPIIFIDRVEGASKMSSKIVREAIFMVWKLKFKKIFGQLI